MSKKIKLMQQHDLMCWHRFVTAKTFDGHVYTFVTSTIVKNIDTLEIKRLYEIYYRIRTVRDIKGNVVARRKRIYSELYRVCR